MTESYSANLWSAFVCPFCGSKLQADEGGARCGGCREHYPFARSGLLDLRLRKSRSYSLEFEIARPFESNEVDFGPLDAHPAPEVDFMNVKVPHHLTAEMMSHFPRARSSGSLVLDLACGDAIHREVCEHAGFEYAGVDYRVEGATPILGDAHAIPFRDATFEFVISIATLEHIRYPFVMMRELHRVMKPGAKLIGTVSFLEPFHDHSYYHHSHLGICNTLQFGGLRVSHVGSSERSGLAAQASMGLFRGLAARWSRLSVWPTQALHRLWWSRQRLDEEERLRTFSGAFAFIATKGDS